MVTAGIVVLLSVLGLMSQVRTLPGDATGLLVATDAAAAVPTLDALPRTLFAEIEEQSKNVMPLFFGSSTTTDSSTNATSSTTSKSAIISSTTTVSSTPTTPAVSHGKYPTFDCAQLLHELKTNEATQKLDPNLGIIYSRRVRDVPSFFVAMHNETFDNTRWQIMRYGTYYEKKLTAAFQEVLRNAPKGARVLDVGGNIGFFSLVSASMGPFVIDTFEPNIKNRMRYCESLHLNRWIHTEFDDPELLALAAKKNQPRTNLYGYGVGQEEGHFLFEEHTNPGMGAVVNFKTGPGVPNAIQIVTLDNFAKDRGWFDNNPQHIAILKVDVEGFEYSVINGAKQLLTSGMVHNIFMEISARTIPEADSNIPLLTFLSEHYRLHAIGGWIGPNKLVNWPKDDDLNRKILVAAKEEGAKQLNLWWRLRFKKEYATQDSAV
ncbi:Inherit from COG: Methyltransferase [Seminavis robusta]|uniref:Inherit from COG: Methyltransferase n=1 Tax=Seminavis robusta TaxID=568900 RepID=A0A9N8H6L2_9STRA|nr:Inherit from COG: Methyltransferase [Seminavis robusta]|eukprot:Sro103_g052390.1 Inherit from COG: Methyltransferase (434) ;mRNA; r:31801-33257